MDMGVTNFKLNPLHTIDIEG